MILASNSEDIAWLDRSGILVSLLCLVHCAVLPVLLALWPALEIFPEHSSLHELLAVLIVVVGGIAFSQGFKIHRDFTVVYMAIVGFSFILFGLFLHDAGALAGIPLESLSTVVGSVFLVSAHLKNLTSCRCESCTSENF